MSPEPSLSELVSAADLLVAHARRVEAIALVEEAMDLSEDPRGLLLLARLHLQSGTKEGASEAVDVLELWRLRDPWDLEGIALLRDALRVLGRASEACTLDRDVRWTACRSIAAPPRPRS